MFKEQQKSSPNSPVFPIPNPNPLLRAFDVPEPVIHPPGVDPYLFLNPKPHGDGVSQTLSPSPLDVDPSSAASRTEIITVTTDLTVSELAGGTLSETTTVVATSDSPANSEVVVQQTLNDVVVKKFENTQITICDVCNVTCYTKAVLKKHMEGKKHLKNMQKLTVSPAIKQEAQPLVGINPTLDQESEKIKKNDLLQNEPSVDSSLICNVTDLGKYNQNIKTEQPVGEIQVPSTPLCSDRLPNLTSASVATAQPSNDDTQEVQGKLNICEFAWCEVCKVHCSSDSNFNTHTLGKKHLKNLKALEKKVVSLSPPPSTMHIASMAMTPITKSTQENLKPTEHEIGEIVDSEEAKPSWCDLCKVSCSSHILSRHLSGKRHMKNLQKSMKLPDLASNPIASVTTLPVEKPKSTKGEAVNPNEVKSTRCELCGIRCNTYEEFNQHISGQKHQKNVKKSEKLFKHSPSPAPGAKRSLEDPMNEDGKAVISERDKRKADSSNDEDSDGKRQKVTEEEGECGNYMTCKACNVAYTSLEAFTSHLASHEHSAMALKQVKLGSK